MSSISSFSCDRSREWKSILTKQLQASGNSAAVGSLVLTPIRPAPTSFTASALSLRHSIRSLNDFLQKQKAEYLSLNDLRSRAFDARNTKPMSNADRDALESEIAASTLQIHRNIEKLKSNILPEESSEVLAEREAELEEEMEDLKLTEEEKMERRAAERERNNADLRAHQHTLIILLTDHLKSVVQLMETMKKSRLDKMKQEVEEKFPETKGKLDALTHEVERAKKRQQQQQQSEDGGDDENKSGDSDAVSASEVLIPSAFKHVVKSSISGLKKLGNATITGGRKDSSSAFGATGVASSLAEEDDTSVAAPPVFSAAESAQLLLENHHLLDSLEENLDAIQRAESKMHEISTLVALFSNKVLEQEEQIATIYDNSIQSTLHVHAGISQLKKAAQRGVTFRMMILMMILMLSFSLLFLDWFMP